MRRMRFLFFLILAILWGLFCSALQTHVQHRQHPTNEQNP